MKNCKFLLLLVLMVFALGICAMATDTVYVNDPENAASYATVEAAIDALPDSGGTVIVCGDTSLALTANQTLPAKGGKVIIRGSEKTVKITIAKDLILGSETEFDNLTLYTQTSSAENLVANGNKLTIGENVITECASGARYIRVFGGSRTANTTYDTHLVLKAGTFRAVLGGNESGKTFTGHATVELSGVTVTTKLTTGNNGSGFSGTGEIILNLCGNKTVTVPAALTAPTVIADTDHKSVFDATTKTYSQIKMPNTVYVNDPNNADAYATFEEAFDALPENGGTIILVGDTTVGTASAMINLPAKSGKVKITSENCAKLIVARTACFNCEIEFDNVDLCTSHTNAGFVYAGGHKLTINENVKTSIANTAGKYLYIYGGRSTDDNYDLNTHLVIKAGTYENIYGGGYNADFTGASKVELSGVTVLGTVTAKQRNTSYAFTGTAEVILDLRGNKTVSAGSFRETPTCLVDDGYEAVCFGSMYFQWKPGQETLDTVYVRDGGTGNGSSAEAPVGSLAFAYALLGADGGEIVLVGDTSVYGGITFPECTGSVTFKAQNDAKLVLNGSIALSKNTNGAAVTFDLPIAATDSVIYGGFRNVTFTENCAVTGTLDYYGGLLSTSTGDDTVAREVITELPYTITVKNGTFRSFGGGIRRTSNDQRLGAVAAHLTVNVSGGSFTDRFTLSGESILADDVTLNITGGTFACPIYVRGTEHSVSHVATKLSNLIATDGKYRAMDGDINIRIAGGTFMGGLIADYENNAAYTQVFRGNYTLDITGGMFAENTVLDASQVKAYADETDKLASVSYPADFTFKVVRFDRVNGVETQYEEPIRIVFIGDSITQGVGASDQFRTSYPARFLELAKEGGRDVFVSNCGIGSAGFIGGDNIYYRDPNRLAYPMLVNETAATYYVIALGTNDYRAALYNGNLQTFINEYTATIEELGALPDTEKVFMASAIPCGSNATPEKQEGRPLARASVIIAMQERLALSYIEQDADKYAFIDLYGLTLPAAAAGTLLSSDDIHPKDSGYVIMAQALYDALFNNVTRPATDYHKAEVYVSAAGEEYASGTAEDPVSRLDVAMGKIPEGVDATVHISGTFTFNYNVVTPIRAKTLTIVGEGEDAVLQVGEDFLINSDIKFDNITLESITAASRMVANYHSVEMTESVALTGDWSFYAGHRVYATPYDTEATASSDRNCTITLNGSGNFQNFTFGNLRRKNASWIGTYSGELTAFVGDGYTASSSLIGAVGQNYLTGTITVSTPFEMSEYVEIGTVSDPIVYDATKNTGTVSVTCRNAAPEVVYLDGTGKTEGAYTALQDAVAAVANGGTIIVCGNTTTQSTPLTLPEKDVTITSENGAVLGFGRIVTLGGNTTFKNITLKNARNGGCYIYCNRYNVVFESDVTTEITSPLLNIYGGGSRTGEYDSTLTVKGGTWGSVYVGHNSGIFSGTTTVTIDGATIEDLLNIGNSGGGTLSAHCDIIVKSGSIGTLQKSSSAATCTYTVTLSGGTVSAVNTDATVDLDVGGSVTVGSCAGTLTTKAPEGYRVVVDGTLYIVAKELVVGDVNGDDAITVVDVLLILKAILNDTALENADMNGDSVLTLVDVIKALKAITA